MGIAAKMFVVITCDNVCELLLMERRVTGKPSCTVRSGEKPETSDTVGLPIAICGCFWGKTGSELSEMKAAKIFLKVWPELIPAVSQP
mgnify:CR=1 FL=1